MGPKKKPPTPNQPVRKWDPDEIVDLITEIQKYPCLYDSSCKERKNIAITGRANAAVAAKFSNCCVADVEQKWAKLKDKYSRDRRLNTSLHRSGSARKPSKPLWPFYELMSFMNLHIKPRETTNLVSRKEVDERPDEVVEIDENEIPLAPNDFIPSAVYEIEEVEAVPSPMSHSDGVEAGESNAANDSDNQEKESDQTNFAGQEPKRKKPKKTNSFEECSVLFKETLATIGESFRNKPESLEDKEQNLLNNAHAEWSLYCKSLALRVSQIESEYARCQIRIGIEELYLKYKFDQHM